MSRVAGALVLVGHSAVATGECTKELPVLLELVVVVPAVLVVLVVLVVVQLRRVVMTTKVVVEVGVVETGIVVACKMDRRSKVCLLERTLEFCLRQPSLPQVETRMLGLVPEFRKCQSRRSSWRKDWHDFRSPMWLLARYRPTRCR